MRWIPRIIKSPVVEKQEPIDLTGIKLDIHTLYKETARNKYKIEEVDIRLANLELACKEFFDAINNNTKKRW